MTSDDARHALLNILRDINDVQRRVAVLWEALGVEGLDAEPPTCAECEDVVVDKPGDYCMNCVRSIHAAGQRVARAVEGDELFSQFDAQMEKHSIDTYEPRKEKTA